MAPKATRGTKRPPSGPVIVSADKKMKVDAELAGVLEAITSADLPEDCRKMLTNFAATALLTAASERQGILVTAVNIIGDCIAAHRAKLEQDLASEQAKLVDIEASRTTKEKQVKDGEIAFAELTAAAEAKNKELAVASQAMSEKWNAVKEAEEAKRRMDESLLEVLEFKKSIETALVNNFNPLKTGESGAEAKNHVEVLLPLVKRIPIDDSLLTVMPSSMPKTPSERGMFDQMIFEQLEKLMQSKIEELSQQLGASETAKLECTAAVNAAQASHNEATEKQKQAANMLHTATVAQAEGANTLEEAKVTLASFASEYQHATQARDDKKLRYDTFVTWNCRCFEVLRDKPAAHEIAAANAAREAARAAKTPEPEANGQIPTEEIEASPPVECGSN